MIFLAVDDNPIDRSLLRIFLEAEGHGVIEARDGVEAIELLAREKGKIQGILSDILMPRMDGYRFCLEVRKHPEFRSLPFIFLSGTYLEGEDEKFALNLGANAFFRKPPEVTKILNLLKQTQARNDYHPARPKIDEPEMLAEYNQRLVCKLEQKNQDLLKEIEERKAIEDQLRTSQEQLKDLASHLQNAREAEATRISREIHDELGQLLTSLKMDLRWIEKKLENPAETKPSEAILQKITGAKQLIDHTIESVQRIAAALRPSVLDDLGLIAALRYQAQEFSGRTGIRCRTCFPPEVPLLDAGITTALFRIVQELLTNVMRHAEASEIEVQLAVENGELVLEVRDNGRGIPVEALNRRASLGILGMKERAASLGGQIEFCGVPGQGTQVKVRMPTDPPE